MKAAWKLLMVLAKDVSSSLSSFNVLVCPSSSFLIVTLFWPLLVIESMGSADKSLTFLIHLWVGGMEKLYNKEFHYLYSSPSINKIMKLRRMRWAGHVARMGRRGTHIGCWWESQRERGH
jgi:hypothetical protein